MATMSIYGKKNHILSLNNKPKLTLTYINIVKYTERNFQTATRHFLIYLNIYDTFMAKIYTQYGKIN